MEMAFVANRAIKASALSAAISTPFRLNIRIEFLSDKLKTMLATAIPK